MVSALLPLVLSGIVGWVLTGAVRRYALRTALLDHPGARSSHTEPTPRGGGVAIVGCYLAALLLLSLVGWVASSLAVAIGGAGALVALVGFVDDRRHVAIKWRLLTHLLAVAWGLAWVIPSSALPDGWWSYWAVVTAVGIALIWLLNFYNFMDGIDGIAGVEALTVAMGAIVIWQGSDPLGLRPTLLVLAGASAGFLLWNWEPARIFMGDVGSGFLGLVFGLSACAASLHGGPGLWSWAILLALFVVDSAITLGRRVVRGERWWEAHRSHAYQRLARRWSSHGRVSAAVAAVNVLWLLPLAWCAALWPALGPWLMLLASAPLVLAVVRCGAGLPDQVAL